MDFQELLKATGFIRKDLLNNQVSQLRNNRNNDLRLPEMNSKFKN